MTGHDRFSCHVTSPTTTTTYHSNDVLPQGAFFVLPQYNDNDSHILSAINEEGVGVQGTPSISFFLFLHTLPQAKQPHHLSVARTQDRGAILPTSTTSTTPWTRDGGALLPTTTTTMTPPSLERETEGLYCPPQPQPWLQPLPCLNVRRRGAIAHNHNHNHNPLARTQDVGALPPLRHSNTAWTRDGRAYLVTHNLSACHHPSVAQNTSGGGSFIYII